MFYFFIVLLNLNLFSIEITERNEDNVKVKFSKNDSQVYELYQSKNGKDFDNKVLKSINKLDGAFVINGLKPNTKYRLKGNDKIDFWTLAKEPKNTKNSIFFLKADENAIKIRANHSGADGALLLVSLEENIDVLNDGSQFFIGKYNESKNKIGNSYVIGNILKGDEVILHNLKYDIYNFALLPYNGSGESLNYGKLENITKYHPQLPAPKPKECEYFKENIAEIKWDIVNGTQYYEAIVAEDENFNNILEEYDEANFGNGDNFKIYLENEQKKYYWKIRAVGLYNSSNYSNVRVIDYNYINSAKK